MFGIVGNWTNWTGPTEFESDGRSQPYIYKDYMYVQTEDKRLIVSCPRMAYISIFYILFLPQMTVSLIEKNILLSEGVKVFSEVLHCYSLEVKRFLLMV